MRWKILWKIMKWEWDRERLIVWEWDEKLNSYENSNQTNHIWERKGGEKDFEQLRNENEMEKD